MPWVTSCLSIVFACAMLPSLLGSHHARLLVLFLHVHVCSLELGCGCMVHHGLSHFCNSILGLYSPDRVEELVQIMVRHATTS